MILSACFINNKNAKIDHRVMSVLYLAIQHTYTEVQVGLYRDKKCLGALSLHKHHASSLLASKVSTLLSQHRTNLTHINFIAVNQGPGPYTTLRVVIATVNGLSFALGIPLVGVDGIRTLVQEYPHKKNEVGVALLNAFNNDVYFAVKNTNGTIASGYANIESLLLQLQQEYQDATICFLGSGTTLHQEEIKKAFPHAHFSSQLAYCPLNALAHQGLHAWQQKKHTSTQLQPLYLKSTFGGIPNLAI